MARERNPARDAALKAYINADGKITAKELAEKFGVSAAQIRKWKSLDKWDSKIKRKRGAPKGNKNAANSGAPERNTNAETHGAYSKVYMDDLTPEQQEYIEKFGSMNTSERLLAELQELLAKQFDLQKKIKLYDAVIENGEPIESMYTDRVVHTDSASGHSETSIEVSGFQRRAVLEDQLNKIHSRIIKCLDSMRAYEIEQKRLDLDERRYQLSKQKISGEFTISDDGDIVDYPDSSVEKVL